MENYQVRELNGGGFGVFTLEGARIHGACAGTFDNRETAEASLVRYIELTKSQESFPLKKRRKDMPLKRTVFSVNVQILIDVMDKEKAQAVLNEIFGGKAPSILDFRFTKVGRCSAGFKEFEIPVDTKKSEFFRKEKESA